MKQKLTDKEYAFWFCCLPEMEMKTKEKLLAYFHTPENIYFSKRCQLEQAGISGVGTLGKILSSRDTDTVKASYEDMEKRQIRFVYQEEEAFPDRLKHIPHPPYGLFYKGNLPKQEVPSVAVVGARRVTRGGAQIADKFGYELAANGIQVISGMALGVDILAQRGALRVPVGRTYAVLGNGVEQCYPKGHIESYMLMQENGGVISEFPIDTPPLPHHFPVRNRIISGLSDGVLVIEAKKGSGSLITAQAGLEQGKEIFAVPGGAFDPQYEGGNELLKNGAVFVTQVRDILDGLGIYLDEDVVERKKKTNFLLETTEKMVYSILSLEPIHVSTILEHTDLELSVLMEVLLSLQCKNLIKMVGNNYFIIVI